MPDLSISFDGVSHAEASRLAQRLLRDYAHQGGNADLLTVTRSDNETQSGGVDLVMQLFTGDNLKVGFEVLKLAVEFGALTKAVMELCDRHDCVVKLRTPRGELHISKGSMDADKLRDMLVDAVEPPKS